MLDDKEFHLDVHVNLNNETDVNLELQVVHEKDWNIRSLLYACRSLDELSHGQDYIETGSVVQISFTDFDLFDEEQEFYSSYMLVNIRNPRQIYCDKILISNVNLRRIDLATEEDKAYRIDLWAKMFKAKTWEEMHMLAAQDKEIDQAASSMWQLTEDRKIREQIRRREANINAYNRKEKMLADAKAQVKALEEQLKVQKDQLKEKDDQLKSKDDQLKEKDDLLKSKDDQLKAQEDQLKSKDVQLKIQGDQLKAQGEQLVERDQIIDGLKERLEEAEDI